MNTKLVGLLNAPELSTFDVGSLLRHVAAAWNDVVSGAQIDIESVRREATNLVDFVRATGEQARKAQAELLRAVDTEIEAADTLFAKYSAARRAMAKACDNLPRPNLPLSEMERTIEIAERCASLTDAQWSRVVELARALAGR